MCTVGAVVAGTSPSDEAALQPARSAPDRGIEWKVDRLLRRMTLDEKIGQMTQIEKNSLKPEDVTRLFIGSVLSGGGGSAGSGAGLRGWPDSDVFCCRRNVVVCCHTSSSPTRISKR